VYCRCQRKCHPFHGQRRRGRRSIWGKNWGGWDVIGELREAGQEEPDAHVRIREVDLGHPDWSMAGFSINNGVEEPVEGTSELHGLGWGLFLDGAVGATPGIVVDEAIVAVGLGDAPNGAAAGCVPGRSKESSWGQQISKKAGPLTKFFGHDRAKGFGRGDAHGRGVRRRKG
jgi:hypothetical protein